jgi:C-terminal processing protease CtpA/Prc
VTRRTGLRGTTVATFDPAARLFNEADYMVLVSEQTLPASGIMGVMLDERDGGDVEVVDFGTGSPAQAAGVKKGDYIVAINGKPVRSFLDVKVLMIDQLPGNEIELTISRDRLLGERSKDSYRFALAAATN